MPLCVCCVFLLLCVVCFVCSCLLAFLFGLYFSTFILSWTDTRPVGDKIKVEKSSSGFIEEGNGMRWLFATMTSSFCCWNGKQKRASCSAIEEIITMHHDENEKERARSQPPGQTLTHPPLDNPTDYPPTKQTTRPSHRTKSILLEC